MQIEEAFRIPVVEGGLVKLLIGAILNLIPIANFFACGYLYDLTRNAINDNKEMPAWDDWGHKFVKGFLVFVIYLVYMLIPLIIFLTGGGASTTMVRGGTGFLAGDHALSTLAGLFIGFIVPMALVHFAGTGNFGAAFSLRTIFAYIRAALGSYIIVYILVIGLIFALMILSLFPVAGWVVSVLGGFYVSCVGCLLFADVYRRAREAQERR